MKQHFVIIAECPNKKCGASFGIAFTLENITPEEVAVSAECEACFRSAIATVPNTGRQVKIDFKRERGNYEPFRNAMKKCYESIRDSH